MARIEMLDSVRFEGAVEGENISAIAMHGDRALVVSDESKAAGNLIQVFKPDGKNYRAVKGKTITLDVPGTRPEEMDLEGIAVSKNIVYAVGSHSRRRPKVDPKQDYQENYAALTSRPKAATSRDVLFRCTLSSSGKVKLVERTSLREFLDTTQPFRSYAKAASKENGVDIEGLAIYKKTLYIGFRRPILRGNFTPVLRCKFDHPVTKTHVMFVNLGGRGIREMTHTQDGLIILAGPVGDGPGSFQLYFWDGLDGVPGKKGPKGSATDRPVLIGDLPLPPGPSPHSAAKAEGISLINETKHHWDLLIVFDGLKDGKATRYRVDKDSLRSDSHKD